MNTPPAMTRVLDPAGLGDHFDRLYRAARALSGSHEHAEDLVQDTFLRMLSRPRLVRNDDDLGYLLTALRNTFFSNQRKTRSRPALATGEQLERIEDPGGPQPHEIVEAGLVFEAIAALPRPLREALVAVDVAGLRYGEAARALGVRETTLTPRLFRARQHVAQMLRPGAHERSAPRVASFAS
jgi:RNA polymerase sigma-70 factor, ECF subfamily